MGRHGDTMQELREPTRALRHALPATWAGFVALHDAPRAWDAFCEFGGAPAAGDGNGNGDGATVRSAG